MATMISGADAARHSMVVSQLRTNAVTDTRLIEAMATVEREAYLPADRAAMAYLDIQVPLPGGRAQNPPLATARLINQADVGPNDTVLLIGAGGGYTAAIVSRLAAQVTAVESDGVLAAEAGKALAGIANVKLVEGDLAAGDSADAPYDVLIVDGAIEHLPDALAEQVRVGGRIVIGRLDRGVTRLAAGMRTAGGHGLSDFADIDCALLPGFAKPRGFQFPG